MEEEEGGPSMDDLPDEVLTEIFRRLPKRLRCKCRSVSKRWSDLISQYTALLKNSGFILGERASMKSEESLAIFFRFDEKGEFTALEAGRFFFPSGEKLEVEPDSLSTCNGLLFFRANNLKIGLMSRVVYYVANPVTKQTMFIPSYPAMLSRHEYIGYGVAPVAEYSVETSWRLIALYYYSYHGAAAEGEEEGAGISSRHQLHVATFDSSVGEWVEIKEVRFSYSYDHSETWKSVFTRIDAPALYSNGTLHWLESSSVNMLCLKTLLFRRIALPVDDTGTEVNVAGRRAQLWVSEGRLKYARIRRAEGFCIWVLEEDGTSLQYIWRKTWCVPYETLKPKVRALGLIFADSIIDACYFVEDLHTVYILMERNRVLLSYDILEETMRKMPFPKFSLAAILKRRPRRRQKCSAFVMNRTLIPWTFDARAKLPNLVGIMQSTTEDLFY